MGRRGQERLLYIARPAFCLCPNFAKNGERGNCRDPQSTAAMLVSACTIDVVEQGIGGIEFDIISFGQLATSNGPTDIRSNHI